MSNKMKAMVLDAPMQYSVKEVDKPACPERGLLVRVIACGLCGSDLRTLKSGHKNISLPWTTGHEVSGEVMEVGTGYRGQWKLGDILAIAPVVYCGTCEFCVAGRYELCDNSRELAQHWKGGFAEYMALPEEALALGTIQKVPEGLDPIIAAVAEPASSCVNAQEKGQVGLGDTVVIIGSGPIGCIHISIARARGAEKIIVADVSEDRLKLCEPFGPDHTIDASKVNLVEEVRRLTNGKGADVVITANPAGQTQVQAVEMAKKGGRILLFGGLPHDNSKPGIDTNLIHYRGLHLIGTTTFAPRHHLMALSMMASGRIPGEKLVTHVLPLESFAEGVDLAVSGKALKVVYKP
ncbi:MAG: alcohol dehydrogenase catalytic domain-containing protein [Clostridia bacterium]|nr:alcohol dehydrogenase catalytic domain-containing protein [Clostridia bacterium]